MRRPGQSTGTVARVARASVSSGDCGRGFHVGQGSGSGSGSGTHEGAGGYAVRGSSSTTTGACACSTAPRHRDHDGLLTCNACACLSCDVEVGVLFFCQPNKRQQETDKAKLASRGNFRASPESLTFLTHHVRLSLLSLCSRALLGWRICLKPPLLDRLLPGRRWAPTPPNNRHSRCRAPPSPPPPRVRFARIRFIRSGQARKFRSSPFNPGSAEEGSRISLFGISK